MNLITHELNSSQT